MWQADYFKHTLQFKFEAGTSRGVLKEKDTWIVKIWNTATPEIVGLGECGPLKGLSIDDTPEFERVLVHVCQQQLFLNLEDNIFRSFPSIKFGFEVAFKDAINGGKKMIFDNEFYRNEKSIPINGLIWMGTRDFLLDQISEKINNGFSCLKMKIGSLDFETEIEILKFIRSQFAGDELVIRVDANGAFEPQEALGKLRTLALYDLHSIEQPIKRGQEDLMQDLCATSPIPVALDEELIGVQNFEAKKELLDYIRPAYIILKPTLLGGLLACDDWIQLAEQNDIGWWITSALESNVGLNAICQYTYEKIKARNPLPYQGLGTGSLYHNNFKSPLFVSDGNIKYANSLQWDQIV